MKVVKVISVKSDAVEILVSFKIGGKKVHATLKYPRNEVPEAWHKHIGGVYNPVWNQETKKYVGAKIRGLLKSRKTLDMLRKYCTLSQQVQKREYNSAAHLYSGSLSRPKYQ